MNTNQIIQFINESNRIEGIYRSPTPEELEATEHFLFLPKLELSDLITLTAIYQPDAAVRSRPGMDVRVGRYIAPRGGPEIVDRLTEILTTAHSPNADSWAIHVAYEVLHPFTDGNGRSGRALWAWVHRDLSLGFLHRFYYQTLERNSP